MFTSNLQIAPAQVGPDAGEPAPPLPGETSRVDPRTGESATLKVTRVTSEDFVDPARGILGTARSPTGRPAAAIKDTSMVTVQGMDMTVSNAVRLGFLNRKGEGHYEEPGREASDTAPAQQGPAAAPEPVLLAPEAAAAFTRLRESLPASVGNGLLTKIVNGGLDAARIDISAEAGIEDREGFQRDLQAAVEGLREQGARAITALGADPDHFMQWAEKNAQSDLRDAMRQHAFSGTAEGYASLVDRYMRTVPPDVETIRAAGHEVFTNRNTGEMMIRLGGVAVRVAVATRMGLI